MDSWLAYQWSKMAESCSNAGRIMVERTGQVLDRVLLRRTKEGRSEDIVLPPKTVVLRKVVCCLAALWPRVYARIANTFLSDRCPSKWCWGWCCCWRTGRGPPWRCFRGCNRQECWCQKRLRIAGQVHSAVPGYARNPGCWPRAKS
jgi:hypothetical protein